MTRAFAGALRFEWIRLRSARSTWILLLAALGAAGLVAWVVARDITAGGQPLTDPEAVVSLLTGSSGVSPLSFSALFAGLIGVLAFGQDYRHGLMGTTLTAIPRRGVLLTAKLTITAVFATVIAVLSVAVAYAVGRAEIGAAWTPSLLEGSGVARGLGGFAALVLLTALLGLALGALIRSMLVASVALVSVPLLVEPLAISGLTQVAGGEDLAAYLPFTAGAQMVNLPAGDGPGFNLVEQTALAGGLTFLAFVAVATLLSSAVFARRDA